MHFEPVADGRKMGRMAYCRCGNLSRMNRFGVCGSIGVFAAAWVAALALGGPALAGNTLRVPQDYSTIQAAVDAAVPGDVVAVSPGTYHELIDNHSKAITIESTGGADVTTIDGGGGGDVVHLTANPGETPVLRGFTIQHGSSSTEGGGVTVSGGPALVEDNRVVDNISCEG